MQTQEPLHWSEDRRPLESRTDDPVLQFTENGQFKITVFSDFHFAEDDKKDKKSQKVMRTILDKEKPQLVVLNGDFISGETMNEDKNSNTYVDEILEPLISRGIPWASTHGNHDSEIHLDPVQMFRREKEYKGSLTRKMVSESRAGVTNYYLLVYPNGDFGNGSGSAEGNGGDAPAMVLWFFDSRGGHYARSKSDSEESIPRANWVDETVINWFLHTSNSLNQKYNRTLPSLAFFHIPVSEMLDYQEDNDPLSKSSGINDERVNQQGYGGGFDFDDQDAKFMRALADTEGLIATFSGHDHGNDWCMEWNPGSNTTSDINTNTDSENTINLCYDRHTGYGGYGSWDRGGRQILLQTPTDTTLNTRNLHTLNSRDSDQSQSVIPDARTWVRLENGAISGDMDLTPGAAGVFASTSGSSVVRLVGGNGVGGSRLGAVVLLAWVVLGRFWV